MTSKHSETRTTDYGRIFRTLSLTTVGMVFVLIIVGGIVRTTGSGLGCPDWPLCYGRLVPPPDVTAWIEFSHRAVAGIAGVLMIATLGMAWRFYRERKAIYVPVTLAIGLLVVQVPLGAVVVATHLEPLIVGFHLGMALLIFAGLIVTAIMARKPAQTKQDDSPRLGLMWGALAATFALMMTGATVVGSRAQVACPDWPLCYGGIVPPDLFASPLILIQLIHRFSVVAVSVLVVVIVVMAFRRWSQIKGVVPTAVWLGALFTMQIMVGGLQVLFILPTVYRVLHLAFAAAIWGALVAMSVHLVHAERIVVPARTDEAVDADLVRIPAGD